MKKGKNGQQIALENILLVGDWITERNACRDWHEYEYNGKINRRALSDELGFAKSVCTQNKAVRALINDAEAIWFRKQEEGEAAHEAALERAENRSSLISSTNNTLTRKQAELETENNQLRREKKELEAENNLLRKELAAHKKQQALIQAGNSGFKA